MKRVLDFTGEKAAKRFTLLQTSILQYGDGKGERTREIIRKEARLLDALDGISHATSEKDETRVLNEEGGSITLSQEDFGLLITYVDKTPWMPFVSRAAVDLQDWLESAEKID